MNARNFIVLILCGMGLAAPSGCQRQGEEIRHYRVLKPTALAEINKHETSARIVPIKTRMLAAIVPHGSKLWFFKLAGPRDSVAQQVESFSSFLGSLHFGEDADSNPEWTAPEGWSAQPGSEMRFATLKIDSDTPGLELTVTVLSQSGNLESDIYSNVARWRGQLKLPPISQDELADYTKTVELKGTTATVVNFEGEMVPNSMGPPPFSKGRR